MQIAVSRSSSQTKFLLVAGLLAVAAIALSVLPTLGLGGHQHWLLYLVATHQLSVTDFISRVLGLLPGWALAFLGKDGVIASLRWIFGWVAANGIAAIWEAIAALSSTGIGGLIVGILGAATLG